MTQFAILMIALGGALGSIWRFMLMGRFAPLTFALNHFPVGILFTNIFGSLLMGVLVGWLLRLQDGANYASSSLYLFFGIGVLGGLTTFSAFALDTIMLLDKGQWGLALLYVLLSVVGSVLAVFLGLWLMRVLFHVG